MTKRNKNFTFLSYKNFILDSIKSCKVKTLVLFIVMLITFLTGIIVAIKTKSDWGTAGGLGIIDAKTGSLTSTFFTRLMSMFFIFLVLFGSSYFPFLFPVAVIMIAYRSYLLGLNACLIIILHGFSGALISILIAFPCQLVAIAILALFYLLLCQTIKDFHCFGGSIISNQKMLICLATIVILIALCVVESILLLLFNARIVLII